VGLGDSMIMTLPYTGAGITLGGGPTYPLLVVTCGLSGYFIVWVDARVERQDEPTRNSRCGSLVEFPLDQQNCPFHGATNWEIRTSCAAD
jgi:hypothetical protein